MGNIFAKISSAPFLFNKACGIALTPACVKSSAPFTKGSIVNSVVPNDDNLNVQGYFLITLANTLFS